MHKKTWKKIALLLAFGVAMNQTMLHAQLLGPYGTSPFTFEVDANGLLSDTGTFGTGTLSLSGAGTRMIWYPGKAAFRAGYVSGTQWNDANIGSYSIAMGENATASGSESFAIDGTASGGGAIAIGENSTSSGSINSIAIGDSSATSIFATAIGGSSATNFATTAVGYECFATANDSSAFGYAANATGGASTAIGYFTQANANFSCAVGTCNVGGGNATSWISTDPLFEVGNGTSMTTRSDALIIYKNGNTTVQGVLSSQSTMRCHPGGDISMGSFTAGTAP